jgi:hypothetical protein
MAFNIPKREKEYSQANKDLDKKFIQTEFQSCLNDLKNEFLGEETELYRFRLFEMIFLERCAYYD